MTGRRLRHGLELAAFVAGRRAIRSVPHPWARFLGRRLGALAWLADRRHRRVVLDNLGLAFPEWSAGQRRRTAQSCFGHFGAMIFDTISFARFDAVETCRRLTLRNWERVEQAERPGRGVLVISAHLGNWEILAHALSLYRPPIHSVSRPFSNPLVYRRVAAERQRFGTELIAKQGAAKQLLRVIRDGGKVGVIMDQRVRPPQGLQVPFFGHPALTTPLPAQVALRTGAMALPLFAFPRSRGRYEVRALPPIAPPAGDPRDTAAVAELTGRYLAVIEAQIRQQPEQWLWMHRRWRLD